MMHLHSRQKVKVGDNGIDVVGAFVLGTGTDKDTVTASVGCFFSGRGCFIRHSIIITLCAPFLGTGFGNGTWVTTKKNTWKEKKITKHTKRCLFGFGCGGWLV